MFKINDEALWDRHELQVEGRYDLSCSCGWYDKGHGEHPVTHILKDMMRETLKELL